MTDSEAEILLSLFGPLAQSRPIENRVHTIHYNRTTKVGRRAYDAAGELERRGLVRILLGTQPNIFQIFPRS